MIIEKIVVGEFEANCYIVGCEKTKKAVIIDPGAEEEKIKRKLAEKELIPEIIINTHGHIDHIGANDKFNLPVFIHNLDKEFLYDPSKNLSLLFSEPFICNCEIKTVDDGDVIQIGDLKFGIIHTPGHTPGSICLKIENFLFSGDTIFANGIGRTDFPGSDEKSLFQSIKKIFTLPRQTILLPGHGPSSTIEIEKNCF